MRSGYNDIIKEIRELPDIKYYSSFRYKLLRKIGLGCVPIPPFKIGQKVEYLGIEMLRCKPHYIYTVYSLYLSNNEWHLKLEELDFSFKAKDFKICLKNQNG